MNDNFAQAFKDEAKELLGELEDALLEMEDNPGDMGIVGRVFRTMHTIKGSGAMFGFDDIASFTHNVETDYDLVRNGELPVNRELVSLSLAARDRISAMLEAAESGAVVDLGLNERVIEGFRALVPAGAMAERRGDEGEAGEVEPAESEPVTYRIRFRPNSSILCCGVNPLSLLRELQELGPCTTVAHIATTRSWARSSSSAATSRPRTSRRPCDCRNGWANC